MEEDSCAEEPKTTFSLGKLPPFVLIQILSYVHHEHLLNGLLMTSTETMDVVRGLVPFRRVSSDPSVDSRRVQALAYPGSVVEYTGSRLSQLPGWQRLVTGRKLRKLVVDDAPGLKNVNVRPNLPYFRCIYSGRDAGQVKEELPFFDSVEAVSLVCAASVMRSKKHTTGTCNDNASDIFIILSWPDELELLRIKPVAMGAYARVFFTCCLLVY